MVLPAAIDAMSDVHTWIIEIHPGKERNPQDIIDEFLRRGFSALWVNRDMNCVEPYPGEAACWKSHTTVFFLRGAV